MQNILIAERNIDFVIELINDINNNKDIRICNITRTIKEFLQILNTKNYIDIIILDDQTLFYIENDDIRKIKYKGKYGKAIVEIENKNNKENNKRIICIIIDSNKKISEITKIINEIVCYKESTREEYINKKIINELSFLGYDFSLKGTIYLIETIKYISLNKNIGLDKLEKNIYPKIGKIYNTSAHNVKCRINSATTAMYYNCEAEKLKHYFNFNIDEKPKTKSIIKIILNKLR